MPITARPDPNNPGQWIWVDAATGQPATQPGGPNTPYRAPSDQPTNVDIAPPGSAAAPTPAPTGPATPTAPALGQPGFGGQYTVDQILAGSDQELNQANQDVAKIWDEIRPLQQTIQTLSASTNPLDQPKLASATSQLNALYSSLSQSMQRVETANASRATTLQKAIDSNQLTPSQVDLAKAQTTKAQADSDLARTQGDVLQQGSQGQRDLVAAQAGLASQQGLFQQAQAAALTAKTPAEKAQLEAQAAALSAQANSTNALLPGLIDKQRAETGLTQAQTNLTGSQSTLAQAQATQATASAGLANAQAAQTTAQTGTLLPAQVGLAGGQEAQARAAAAASQADIQKGLQGPLYGLQDQIKAIQAIQQQVFGPGGSGNPQDANDLLNQYVTATVSGTTPYAANVAAANAGLTAFGTQASLANAAQQAAATRASAFTGLGGNVLGTLAALNANAPAGSTAMAGAFNDVMNQMQSRLQAPQFAGGPTPTAPALPALLQKLAPPGADQTTPTGPGPLPGVPPAASAAPGLPFPTPPTGGAPQTSAPVTINIGGAPAASQPAPAPTWTGGSGATYVSPPPGTGTTPQRLPSMLQQYAPPTTDFVHQLWSNELGSGAVRSPYAAMGQAG
jgi:hypothetical protein